jgi:hypothetical protein
MLSKIRDIGYKVLEECIRDLMNVPIVVYRKVPQFLL